MREIKFRGKEINGNKWVKGSLLIDRDLDTYRICEFNYYTDENGYQRKEFCCQVDSKTVGEYTGVKDKNGDEIYEGDIFRTGFNDSIIAVVEWCEDTCRFLGFTVENERRIVYVDRSPKFEVIGNIYENPELLEAE